MKSSSQSLSGIGASPGMVLGRAHVLERSRVSYPRHNLVTSEEVALEQMRLRTALDLSERQLVELKAYLPQGEGAEHGLILEAHRLMLRDPLLADESRRLIDAERINAEWAVKRVVRRLKTAFENLEDDYFRERRADIEFVGDRVVRNLLGQVVDVDVDSEGIPRGSIVVAHDLTPADATVLMQRAQIAGFVTEVGAQTSHVAIVARARQIPGVVGVARAAEIVRRGDLIAIDGHAGAVLVNPTDEQVAAFQLLVERHAEAEQAMLSTAELPTVSADGVQLVLNGNIEFSEEVRSVLAHGAAGIGLYRTEFLFLSRDLPPTEEEHFQSYRAVVEQMGGRPVTIRTVDLGADKLPRGPGHRRREREANPAMGLRAVRYSLKHRDVFLAQLKALLRASVHGNLRIMFPMITGLTELREVRAVLERAREELARAGQPFAPRVPVGIMVETPSAAVIADKLALESDFFSIGTNDLIQYSMAIDRQNREVAYLYRPLHPAILRSLKFIVDAAHAAGIQVSMCGEMAADPLYTLVLMGLGLDELSMAAGQIPVVKQLIRRARAADGRALVEHALRLNTAEEIERVVRGEMQARFGELVEGS